MTPSIFMALYKRVKYNTNNKKVVGTHITNEAVRIVIWKAAANEIVIPPPLDKQLVQVAFGARGYVIKKKFSGWASGYS